ncbi:uncharacterized protein LOC118185256 [Stegodyphus dumicola]|uniref:uncharacterized protein LOC118185256 n=1 Tax=Stegodyphus dumicola TaxID=202533 RepID=UPI0015A9CA59|nr:uncharacterized protein LOC118185256 [Stegodyphus dumicola]
MELKEVIQFLRWLVTFRSPKEILVDHTSFLAVEVLFYIGFVLTLKHAVRNGGRYFYLWLAALVHGLAVESLSYMIPDIDSFWHAQSSVMLFGQRLPLHIVCFYPVLIYTASVAVSRMKLPLWSEMCAVGIAMVVLDIPNDIIGIKLLWWTFHDTDPNLAERLYWVPWTSYFFFGAFMSSLIFCLHTFRKVMTGNKKYSAGGHLTGICCAIASGIIAIPLGILQFALLYHIPHDIYKVPASVCTIIYLTTLCLLAWTGDRSVGTMTKLTKVTDNYQKKVDELFLFVVLYFSFFAILTFVAQPQTIFSAGFHQPIGSCDEKIPVHTPIGMVR